ncbi:MAG: ribonuclease P protein component [Bacteroidales bacterium]|nr:ribonuclease P protein component [Bacteroidales bacterium]
MKRYTFKKSERLCSKRYIKYLFAKGEKILVFPFSVYWCVCVNEDIPAPAQVMISVSKRKMKHAVDRNHTKRVIRECYRLHKENLYETLAQKDCKILLSINYLQDKKRKFPSMEQKYMRMLDRLTEAISNIDTKQ